jgi:hypothetical protein
VDETETVDVAGDGATRRHDEQHRRADTDPRRLEEKRALRRRGNSINCLISFSEGGQSNNKKGALLNALCSAQEKVQHTTEISGDSQAHHRDSTRAAR